MSGKGVFGIEIVATSNGLNFIFTDSGPGISPELRKTLFQPFVTTKANGMGMGLAVSRTIIEAHGGELWMQSKVMEGSTFTILLPPAGTGRIKDGDLPASA